MIGGGIGPFDAGGVDRRHVDGDRGRPGDRDRHRPAHRGRAGRRRGRVRRVVRLAAQGHRQPDPRRAVRQGHDRRGDAGDRAAADRPQGRQRLADADRARSASPTWTTPTPASRRRRGSARSPTTTSGRTRPASCGRTRSGTRCCTAPSTASAATSTRPTPRRAELLGAAAGSGGNRLLRGLPEQRLGGARPADRLVGDHPAPIRRDARHLQRALELAVRAGHDTDTTAAIAGGAARRPVGRLRGARPRGGGSCTAGRGCEARTWSRWRRAPRTAAATTARDGRRRRIDRYAGMADAHGPVAPPARRRGVPRRVRRGVHRRCTTR